MSVDTSVSDSEDLFGKTISDLQTGVVVGSTGITGTLKYVDDYTGFSSRVEEQSGNYLVLHATTDVEGATISVKVTNPVVLDADGIVVLRIADKSTQTVTVVASKSGYTTATKVFSLTGLTVEAAG